MPPSPPAPASAGQSSPGATTVRKLGLLFTSAPALPPFRHGVRLAEAALAAGVQVYAYCLDDAVPGVSDPTLQALRARGLHLYACAYGARKRRLRMGEEAVYAGLTVLSDILSATDRCLVLG